MSRKTDQSNAMLATGYRGLGFYEWMRLKWWQKLLYKWRQNRSVLLKSNPKYCFCSYERDRARRDWLNQNLESSISYRTSCRYKCGKTCNCRRDEDGTLNRWFTKDWATQSFGIE